MLGVIIDRERLIGVTQHHVAIVIFVYMWQFMDGLSESWRCNGGGGGGVYFKKISINELVFILDIAINFCNDLVK